ncbi:hypothetical protein, variant [Aphanomyces astaci]|uniref:Uncharacterized protein n=2 Tax=Aphanomyces astaci TaxID=112090 RepID=W4GR13_APHAT|nr:hypothetical protein, variant [Aphanomyces astaci]ETV81781.1 hypothetical protein, variant [Aphanomyces astaci]|eukprot:XP_009828518.1 hypothetical protein, variant [Aphanomyces astaci]
MEPSGGDVNGGGHGGAMNSLMEAKTQALNHIHGQKVRTLMKSIHQLQDQVATMKAQDKEHRRSALIQNLRKQQRDQELVLDVLKDTLKTKVGDFHDSLDAVNEFILKKTLGGPKRFRPKTREELELEFVDLDQKYKRAMASLKRVKSETQQPPQEAPRHISQSHDVPDVGAMQRELEALRVLVAAKDNNLQTQATDIQALKTRMEDLLLVHDKWERTKAKYVASKAAIAKLQDDAIRLIQAKELEVARREQVDVELAWLKDVQHAEKGDSATLQQQVETFKAQHAALQLHIDEQQQKWTDDRLAIMAQLRTQESHVASIEAQSSLFASQVVSLTAERDGLQTKLNESLAATATLQQMLATHADDAEVSNDAAALTAAATKETELLALVEAKHQQLKAYEKQILASKLLARLHKKEKEQLLLQLDKLRTLVSTSAPPTDASRVIAQAQLKLSVDVAAPTMAVERHTEVALATPPAVEPVEHPVESPGKDPAAMPDQVTPSLETTPNAEIESQQEQRAPQKSVDFVNGVVASALLGISKDSPKLSVEHQQNEAMRPIESPSAVAAEVADALAEEYRFF